MAAGEEQQLDTLLLVPTDIELAKLADHPDLANRSAVEFCGFGPVEAAARTATLVARYRPRRVLLLGIAGTYDEQRLALGTAALFREVFMDGVGGTTADEFINRLPQPWGCDLHVPRGESSCGALLTCCAASANAGEVEGRKRKFPAAVAEDMEGFAVARACELSNVPLAILRGFSNIAGDLDHANWRIDKALAAVAELAGSIVQATEPWELCR